MIAGLLVLAALAVGLGATFYAAYRLLRSDDSDLRVAGWVTAVVAICLSLLFGALFLEGSQPLPDGCYRVTSEQRTTYMPITSGKVTTIMPVSYNGKVFTPVECN